MEITSEFYIFEAYYPFKAERLKMTCSEPFKN
jgi:hypothetical protein